MSAITKMDVIYQKWMSDIAKMDVRHFGCHMSQMDVRHFGCHILTMDVFYFKNGCQTFQKWMSHISKTDVRHFGCRMSKMDVRHFGCHISKMDVKHFKNGCPSRLTTKIDDFSEWAIQNVDLCAVLFRGYGNVCPTSTRSEVKSCCCVRDVSCRLLAFTCCGRYATRARASQTPQLRT